MGRPTAFLEHGRLARAHRPVTERLRDWEEIPVPPAPWQLVQEAERCLDCGTPYCHLLGCPLANLVPEWNDALCRGRWREAWLRLQMTHPLPEITGRVCPAPCEASCTLSIHSGPVAIRELERAVAERAFAEGWVTPRPPLRETGRRVAVVGSGPAGLAAAQGLRRLGHSVSLFEKSSRIGGLLRFGIPRFKLPKGVLDRRLAQLQAEGVEFETGVAIGEDLSARYLRKKYDALVLAVGAGHPRDLDVPGRRQEGIHFAMEYLGQEDPAGEAASITARGRRVLVVGGGDTGADCVGTAARQGALSIHQVEILPRPREWPEPSNPEWPRWPAILRSSTSHEEGCTREWGVSVTRFAGGPRVEAAHFSRVEWKAGPTGRPEPVEVPGSQTSLSVELVLLAMGFLHPVHSRLLSDLGVELDARGNIRTGEDCRTSEPGVFACGDAASGASLVVSALAQGLRAAASVDGYLKG